MISALYVLTQGYKRHVAAPDPVHAQVEFSAAVVHLFEELYILVTFAAIKSKVPSIKLLFNVRY